MTLILKDALRITLNRTSVSSFLRQHNNQTYVMNSKCDYRITRNIRKFCSGRRTDQKNNCSSDKNVPSSPSLGTQSIQEPTPETDIKTISDKIMTKNMVFGSTVIDGSTGEWLTLNEKINTYPSARRFTAIGLGGDDFVRSMVVAVESVVQHPVPQGYVKQRVSSGGKYVSVNIGPVRVISREQVEAVYKAMRSDERMKFFL
ncbi:hypothetical protein QVD17_31640 [Tagetes erecta]|uniref:Uncharacterized protein n=1 Tax=Tagetes erecta TaxID=13708 RepID=A0AAD8K473_TARER|nr:hypothetical protein QVD17_31640 [Tagetes erecta]